MTEPAHRTREVLYVPHTRSYFLIFIILLSFTLFLLFLGVIGVAFRTLFPNLGAVGTLILLSSCLMGSYINVPITRIKTEKPVIIVRHIKVFGITYHVPTIAIDENETLLAINVGAR